ncbi:MAG: hypothetical protein I3J02_04880 [Prevotella sp.]|nr:hypothetical protein [Prevotella sp.]
MIKLHIFNPEHDIALAAHQDCFTAPFAGRQLRHDLGFLPALWADEGDFVLVDDLEVAQQGLASWAIKTPARLVDPPTLTSAMRNHPTMEICPWGWDRTLRHQLLGCGISAGILPSDDTLERIRTISHRGWAARRLLPVLTSCTDTIGEAWAATSVDEVAQSLSDRGPLVVKAPWSSSGRGVRFLIDRQNGKQPVLDFSTANWMKGVIRRQGCVMVEPYYNKEMDFGLEFMSDGQGQVTYLGLSLFHTANSAYTGNLLDTEPHKLDRLSAHVSPNLIEQVKELTVKTLSSSFKGVYTGPFGLDMMVVRKEGSALLHPCVELNLRRTMGHVALSLSDGRFPLPSSMQILFDGRYHLTTTFII